MLLKRRHVLIKLLLIASLSGCSNPAARLHDHAIDLGYKTFESLAGGFSLTSYTNLQHQAHKRLHVYLEGDGRPWEQGRFPSSDPTTRSYTVLTLMATDPNDTLYLGRPCYNGHAQNPACTANLWTAARYGEAVVAVMTEALQDFCTRQHYREVVLIGHSGGGTLALLIAERLPQTLAVVTLAANYDIDIWADHHGYQRLSDSLNPAARQVKSHIPEWHLLGKRDSNIPPALFQQALTARPNSQVQIVDADHSQGWLTVWPHILHQLSQLPH